MNAEGKQRRPIRTWFFSNQGFGMIVLVNSFLFFCSFFFFSSQSYGIDTTATGYKVVDSGSTEIDAHGTCQVISNSSGRDQFVSTKTSGEWSNFLSNLPTGMSKADCSSGYFVLTHATYNGNMGGLSGANSNCLTELNAKTWKGKADAGTLASGRVKAFLCDESECNDLNSNTTYKYARANDASAGGASFVTGGTGLGPNDYALKWTDATVFNDPPSTISQYWTGRESTASVSFWPSTPHAGETCDNWTSSSSGDNGGIGMRQNIAAFSESTRWSIDCTEPECSCDKLKPMICFVNPE